MDLTERQRQIVAIVGERAPITGEQIADSLATARATIRSDLAVLTMMGILGAKPRVGYYLQDGAPVYGGVRHLLAADLVRDHQGVPIVVPEQSCAYDAVVTLFLEDVGSLFVVRDDGQLAGVVSRKDLLKVTIGKNDLHQLPISMVMTRMPNIATVTPDDSLLYAAELLIRFQVDSLPVIRQDADAAPILVGRITKTTIVRWLVARDGPTGGKVL
jgi:CBS domain-containing protein